MKPSTEKLCRRSGIINYLFDVAFMMYNSLMSDVERTIEEFAQSNGVCLLRLKMPTGGISVVLKKDMSDAE